MIWRESWRADPEARVIADRHYNRQKIGATQFVPPGSCAVFVAGMPADALWITSAPYAEYVKHEWAGAWVCSCYRNERPGRTSSVLIREAVAATRHQLGEPPALGMVTFVDVSKVRKKAQPGKCFIEAGFTPVGHTKGGLLALLLSVDDMPDAAAALPRYEAQHAV